MQDISELILKYNGPHPYLKILKKKITKGEVLEELQIKMAEKMLISVASLSKDKSLLPLDDIKDLEIDWEKYSERKPYIHQKIATNWLLNKKKAILADDMGLGKRIADDIPVLTPKGWINHGSLKIGDEVIGSNGEKTKVLATYPNSLDNYYTITFTDGEKIESCENHLWKVFSLKENKSFVLTIKEMLDKTKPLDNSRKSYYKSKTGGCKWYIPIVKPVEFEERKIEFDPYLLGVMLYNKSLTKDICEEVCKEINDKQNFDIFTKEKEIESYLSKVSFCQIPDDYKFNSIHVRLEVLQALMDLGGYFDKNTICFSGVSKTLVDDVKELIQSLGGIAKIENKEVYYKLVINFPSDFPLFKNKKKLEYLNKKTNVLPYRGIKNIEFSRKTSGQCIKVEAEDSLYVIDKYVVTHNTQSIVMAIKELNVKTIIVCPKTLRLNWKIELSYFISPEKISIIDSKWVSNDIIIINYDKIHKYLNEIIKEKFVLSIADESHYVKNAASKRGKVFSKIATKTKNTWLITGTPMANRPMDFYNLLKICKHSLGKNKSDFGRRYCDGKLTDFGWDYSGASNLKDLHYRTQDVMLRRMTSEVVELPEKQRVPYYLEFSSKQHQMYKKAVSDKFQEIYDNVKNPDSQHFQKNLFSGEGFVELAAKRMFCALEKIKDGSLKEMLDNFISQDYKVVIFTNFTAVINYIKEEYGKKCVILNGEVKEKQRQENIESFQKNSSINICACNYIVGAEGTTLTSATVMIMNDLPFSPHLVLQGEKRIHRIGQKNKVQIYYPVYKDTIDEEIFETIKTKIEYINVAIDDIDEKVFETEGDIIKKLIKSKK